MMTIDILTGFPEIFTGLINSSILRNAMLAGAAEIWVHNLRHYTSDRHGNIDDAPYGGGAGMVLMAQPVWGALDYLAKVREGESLRIYMSPQGETLTQKRVRELSRAERIVLLCGHYKDVDGRVFERDEWLEISIGDYVLSGGEIPAAALTDAIVRLLPGAISDPESADSDSFEDGLLDAPYYTRPEEISGYRVPEAMLTGHHENIRRWRTAQRMTRTKERRPDLWNAWLASHPDFKND
jgi:tRNA (guanine37-N1)-methyltransferase